MTARPDVRALHARLAVPRLDAAFVEDELAQLPGPVARYFRAAIEPGTLLARAARLSMRGHIKLGARWVPFRAAETLAPHHGFVWAGRAAGVVTGSDQYADGVGMLDWRLFGLVTVAHAEGPDVNLSAAARAAGEAVWLPTALLPRFDVAWEVTSETEVIASYRVGDVDIANQLTIDEAGRLRSAHFSRWGDPDNTGTFASHPFGLEVTGHATLAGMTIPTSGRVGWHIGTNRWDEGEFFRYQLTDLQPVGPASTGG